MTYDLTHSSDPDTVPDDWYVERMTVIRNRLLVASDWTQLPDTPTDKTAWATYRQQLRDFPATWTPGPTATFPDAP